MDTRFLESLLAVVETGSIAAAARHQGLTSAAVSQRIAVLERDLGAQLFVRTARAVQPTADCLRALPDIRALVRDAERLKVLAGERGLSGPYRLGAISTALQDFVPGVVTQFRQAAPDVRITVHPGSSQALYEQLVAGKLDAVLCVHPPFPVPKTVRMQRVADEPICHFSPEGIVSGRSSLDLPWILYDRSTWGGRAIGGYVESVIGSNNVLCELDSLETIAAMVQQGLGQAVLPVWSGMSRYFPELIPSDLEPGRTLKRPIVLLQNASSGIPLIDRLLQNTLSP